MTKQADLIDYIFEGHYSPLAAEMLRWMDASVRATAFVDTYRDKIRKKIRVAGTPESLLDVRCELDVAFHLLADRRLALVYEPVASEKRRGPDFALTYRVNTSFNVEVARIRLEQAGAERIARILLDKLGQMQPGMPNMLVIQARQEVMQSVDLGQLLQGIKARAEAKDPGFYALTRYASPADFYKDFLRLSGLVLWSTDESAPGQLWINKQARPSLDEKVLRLVNTLLSGTK